MNLNNKIRLPLLACFAFCNICIGQPGEWVWLHGSNIPGSSGNFGVQGFSSSLNDPPALYEPCEWTDLNGNFWLFGGGYQSVNADLWKYDPQINEWTWMKGSGIPFDTGSYGIQGVPSPLNNPSNRAWGAASWTDLKGDLWMFGGYETPGLGFLSDMWKYHIATNEWTWMKGLNAPNQPAVFGVRGVPDPANNPQGRFECAAAWTDNAGDLWMFGGYNSANTLWRYNIASNEWTWMKGDTIGGIAHYGVLGVKDSTNTPGYRWAHTRWKDYMGMLWLFGGEGSGSNDLWRYNPFTNNWTWMNGSYGPNAGAVYGVKCVADSNNVPGSRYEARTAWTDKDGNLWLFGGAYDNPTTVKNDLWKYCVRENKWVWVSGNSIGTPIGNWGTMGVPSPTNKPNGRMGAVGWRKDNNLYFFGGLTTGGTTPYNDLWKFEIDTTCGVCTVGTYIIESKDNDDEIKIYPNPAKNKLTIEFDQNIPMGVEITVLNILGKSMITVSGKNFMQDPVIDISRLSDAVYILEINIDGKKVMRKFIKN